MKNPYHTLGLLSGTSMDAVDGVLMRHDGDQMHWVDGVHVAMPDDLKAQLQALCQPGEDEINRMAACDVALGALFAEVAGQLLGRHPDVKPAVIGCHGQTVRHHPDRHFTMQIGNAHAIVARTGIPTISDFRRRDIVHGGQGAPLAPGFHAAFFGHLKRPLAVVNVGGMANVSLLKGEVVNAATLGEAVVGFDTGPGNALMDAWMMRHRGQAYDDGGRWAMSGDVLEPLLTACLAHPFFKATPPKSTGHEVFHLAWLDALVPAGSVPEDVQRTLLELTARSIAEGIALAVSQTGWGAPTEWVICGGGAYNDALMRRLQVLASVAVVSSEAHGVAPQWVEAMLFAWLADLHREGQALDWGAITGATQPALLGVVYQP